MNAKSGKTLRHLTLLIAGPAIIAAIGIWIYLHGGRYVSTDNAYVKSDIIAISSEISGRVVEVNTRDNDEVAKGQLLFRIDDKPYRIALAKAEANLASVRGTIESEKVDYRNSLQDIENGKTDLEFHHKEMQRLSQLLSNRSVPQAQYDQAEYAWQSARNELATRQQEMEAARALLIDPQLPTEQHPRYLQALAELEKVQLDISHLEVRAPKDGVVAKVGVHEGEYVMAGAQLVSLVDRSRLWLEANFKETDLTWVRPGQSVTVTVDTYPDQEWNAIVEGIMPATGAEFSLLPAQNSSGNWIKVVQRITVNIDLEDYDGALPLSAGMSAEVRIDTGHSRTLGGLAQN